MLFEDWMNQINTGEHLEEVLPWRPCMHETLCPAQWCFGIVIIFIIVIVTTILKILHPPHYPTIISIIIVIFQVTIRPAICDKARKKQQGKPCPNPACQGVLETQVSTMMMMW